MIIHGPERLAGQGLDPEQHDSGNRAIHSLLATDGVGNQVDLVLTWRGDGTGDGAYEVWAQRGMVRFRRLIAADGTLHFEVLDVIGTNPLANQDPLALATLADEHAASVAGGFPADDPRRRFIAPEQQSYPFAYERVAQLFDSPHAPDLAVSPRDWCSGAQPGTHGALHVRQARAPLWFSGAGVAVGTHSLAARSIDIAPTCLAALGFPLRDGVDATGRTSAERGVADDVYLARQDGRVVHEVLQLDGARPTRLYVFLLDGMHQTELQDRLERDPSSLPNLRRLRDRAAVLEGGSIVNFPSITWPSHTAICTGSWGGHHDVVNPSYYLRDQGITVSPQGLSMGTEGYANPAVESIYEAFHRVHPGCVTAAIHAPFGRSATHAVLEGRNLCDRARVKQLTAEFAVDMNPRWPVEHQSVASESVLDTRGVAQVVELFTSGQQPAPLFVYHELALTDGAGHEYGPHGDGLVDALTETDLRIGRVLALLDEQGLFEQTLFVVSADHGMAPQDTALRANPAAHVRAVGIAAEVAEPLIWLHDVAVVAERAADLRTGRVIVAHNDVDSSGERPACSGAHVTVLHQPPGAPAHQLAVGVTDHNGRFGFATPSDIASEHLVAHVQAEGRNERRLRFDGHAEIFDAAAALYGT